MAGNNVNIPEFSTDKDLDEVWVGVLAKYEEITKQTLDPRTTFESFQNAINQNLSNAASKRKTNARKVLSNIGQCLQRLGDIIAQGASAAFAPSCQCWNAITLVLTSAQAYSDVFDGFITLMERCVAFMTRLNIFLDQERGQVESFLPKPIRQRAYAILSHFLQVLQTSYILTTSKREKFKLVLGIVCFSGDAGVKESLDTLEGHIQEFTNTEIDQILLDVKGLARFLQGSDEERKQNHDEIRAHLEHLDGISEETLDITQQMKITLDSHITQENAKKNLETIRSTFDLPKTSDPWVRRHDYLSRIRVKESGNWLHKEELGFAQWIDVHNSTTKVFTLEGSPESGKTYLSNFVISSVFEKYPASDDSDQVHVAYYYFGDEGDEIGKNESIDKCLDSIVYQIACTNVAYAELVAKICTQQGTPVRDADRWGTLITQLRHALSGTYFICIDGYNGYDSSGVAGATLKAIAKDAIPEEKASEGISFRFFLSGTPDGVAIIPQNNSVRRIVLGRASNEDDEDDEDVEAATSTSPYVNSSDLEAVARAKVDDLAQKRPDLKSFMTEENFKKLLASVRGHFGHLEAKLTQINACDTEQKLQAVIDSAGYDVNKSVRDSIEAFNSSLSAAQIQQVNELLVWIVGGQTAVSIDLLQSALYLSFQRNFMLRDLVATTFSGLLTFNNNDMVKLKSKQLLQVLAENGQRLVQTNALGLPANNLGQEHLHHSEIELCRRFIRNACGQVDYDRFNFEAFFDALAGKQKAYVHVVDSDNLNVTIARSCLKVLCVTPEDKNLKALREHSALWFYEYLNDFVQRLDYFEPDKGTLREIGEYLAGVLYDEESIAAWFDNQDDDLSYFQSDWIKKEDFLDATVKFLRSPHARQGYAQNEEKRKWVEAVTSNTVNKYSILTRVARYLAIKWFNAESTIYVSYFWVPFHIVSKIKGLSYSGNYEARLDELEDFIHWAEEHTGLDINQPCWTARVGAIYITTENWQQALLPIQDAQSKLPDTWILLKKLSVIHQKLQNPQSAIDCIQKLKALRETLLETNKEYRGFYWETFLLPEGTLYKELGNYDAAVECFLALLDQPVEVESRMGLVHSEALISLFEIWYERKAYKDMVNLLQEMRDTEKAGKPLTYWLWITYPKVHFHGKIMVAARQAEAVDQVYQFYDQALKGMPDFETDGDLPKNWLLMVQGQLRHYQAALTFYGHHADDAEDRALGLWETAIRNQKEYPMTIWTAKHMIKRLAVGILDKGATYLSEPDLAKILTYTGRLEELARLSRPVNRKMRQTASDPRFCLVRLHVLRGDIKSARHEAKVLLRGSFDSWPEDPNDYSLETRLRIVAQILTVFNLDEEAVAVWQAIKPRESTSSSDTNNEPQPDAATTQPDEANNTEPTAAAPTEYTGPGPKAYLESYHCDACEVVWEDMLDVRWACKNCLDVQLCSPCYEKLQLDALHPLICSKEHEFLHIPKFDHEAWQRSSALNGMVLIVGGKAVAGEDWIREFRDKWEVQQEQIDDYRFEAARGSKAATTILRYYMKWRKKKTKDQTQVEGEGEGEGDAGS
ncbi:hypothetical protein BU24DRAFT_455567 [Aaosphaeria arxii CBS 175.79]|uniref:Uncharacterized protein n=1 Tax=Aaosphaeria arxii CBS 175.79 TaxID=1450172 RepID=A0A6A5X9I2_9PLEO|nr:uncharacterized protein BU24DRAFT_455567 [Aaosphaeria arxii CBS 175.79]KAF2009622.1 hypothetical protein BU24DRAFT_455567 [Aaosphaeria arxii CBS 175.79]